MTELASNATHSHGKGVLGALGTLLHWHGHGDASVKAADPALATAEGIRVVWLALAALGALGATTLIQIVIVALSGSVALLADTLHNIGDTLNSIPLLIAFYLSHRLATRRYTYGFGRAEDVAGVLIVLSIAVSRAWTSLRRPVIIQPKTRSSAICKHMPADSICPCNSACE